jgi:cell division protein FtsW (lipid II flippase)
VAAAPDPSVSAAVHLTVAGALVTVASLVHRDHRHVAWVGGLLLAGATWVRLNDLGVHAPEPYTLPTAIVLILVGLRWMNRDVEASTTAALLPGLTLATLPTLLWALADPLSPRAVVMGAVFLALLLGGASMRWTAPVLVGWLGAGLLLLRELAPYAVQTPQWMLIGAAGTVLIGAGVTWEARVRDLRRATAYMARLR